MEAETGGRQVWTEAERARRKALRGTLGLQPGRTVLRIKLILEKPCGWLLPLLPVKQDYVKT